MHSDPRGESSDRRAAAAPGSAGAPDRPDRPDWARLPAVGRLLETPPFRALSELSGRSAVTEALRGELAALRRALRAGAVPAAWERDPEGWLRGAVERRLERAAGPDLRRVINATGVAAHTNLGRAPLSPAAAARMFEVASGYSDLEFDRESGRRGSRQEQVAGLLAALFPGRASLTVNNAAAAVLLALDSLAAGKRVVVSRGELLEIGDSFRIPEIIEKSGARLLEVGTTNRTRLSDYRRAVESAPGEVGALLRVHPSNFRVVGFTESAATRDLAALAAEFDLPLVEDFGSGNLRPLGDFGVAPGDDEPTVGDRLGAGADLVIFSGDKLLGGPQAGILVGSEAAVAACRRNPLARAVRADKTCLAALQETLRSHVSGRAAEEIPVLRALSRTEADLAAAARVLREALRPAAGWTLAVVESHSRVGGGAAPGARLPTRCLAFSHPDRSADSVRAALLRGAPPVVGRIREERVLLDLRTVMDDEAGELAAAVQAVVGESSADAAAPPGESAGRGSGEGADRPPAAG